MIKLSSPKNRRLRKKLHIGEFAEFAYSIHANAIEPLAFETSDQFMDDWIGIAEANGLSLFMGIGPSGTNLYITSAKAYTSPTPEHVQLFVAAIEATKLFDDLALHGPHDVWYDETDISDPNAHI